MALLCRIRRRLIVEHLEYIILLLFFFLLLSALLLSATYPALILKKPR